MSVKRSSRQFSPASLRYVHLFPMDNLFELTNAYEYVYKWFEYLKTEKHISIISYVIMPNHLHLIIHLPDPTMKLNKIIGNGKRFLAYAIIDSLEHYDMHDILTS